MWKVIIIPTLTDWCAKLYQDWKFRGWEYVVTVKNGISTIPSSKNNDVSSIRMRIGCQLTAYQDNNGENSLFI